MRESPFDRTLFLDTDTTVVGAVEPLFYLLDRFDIGLHMHPHYRTYGTYERGGYLSTANTGVVLFRRCAAVSEMFDRWLEAFDWEVSVVQSRITDDPTLMYAVYDTPSSARSLAIRYEFSSANSHCYRFSNSHYSRPSL